MYAFLAGAAIFFGEFFIIGAEMWAARRFESSASQFHVFATAFGVSLVACFLLVFGYTYGYQVFKNIWIVTAISISGILVVEPIIAWLLFKEIPTMGAGAAFVLAAIGIVLTLVWK